MYAGFWRRVAASFVDGLILTIPGVVLGLVLRGSPGLSFLIQVLIGFLYYTLLHSSQAQATWGKRAFDIKVTDTEGERISYVHAVGRYFAVWLSGLILGIGFLMAAFTGSKQALHDLICGTLVVKREIDPAQVAEGAGAGTMPMTSGVWIVIVLFMLFPVTGILAAIAIPAYNDFQIRARMVEAFAAAGPLKQQVEQAHAANRPWTSGPATVDSRHVRAAEITPQGDVLVTLADDLVRNGRIRFTPTDVGGAVQWKCSAEDVMPRYLPPSCRP
jgi:uncharacterized RDD family membrane protein YckC/Tfp pilus assembly major pilin PilA